MNEKNQLKFVVKTVNNYFKYLKERKELEDNDGDPYTKRYLDGLINATDDVLMSLGIDTNPLLR